MKEELFSIPYYHYSLDNWKEKKEKLLSIYNSTFKKINENVITNWEEDSKDSSIILNKIFNILEKDINKFSNDIGYNFIIKYFWFQEYLNGMDHSCHTHGSIGYSSVLYINFDDKEHNSTNFISPFICPFVGIPIYFSPKIKEGDIIFFPSNILHYVSINKSNKSRLICSFNLEKPKK